MLTQPLDEAVDHVRGPANAPVILEYGDYECPYSRKAFREIERVERGLTGGVRYAFRHFPLTEIHPHAFAASAAAEAASLQHEFWRMHELLFHRQRALEDDDLRRYAAELGLDVTLFDSDRIGAGVLERVPLLREALGDTAKQIQYLERESIYTRPLQTLAGYDAILRQVLGEGAPAVRLIGELPVSAGAEQCDTWTLYEAVLSLAF